MEKTHEPDTEKLLDRADNGDNLAIQSLMSRHRDRLRQMVTVRMDERLISRIDPSDIVQEALLTATKKLDEYLKTRPVPFYPWLRQIAWETLLSLHDHHITKKRRSLLREAPQELALSDRSAVQLAEHLIARTSSPSDQAIKIELRDRVRNALNLLQPSEREILLLRFLEQLSTREAAFVLNISEGALRMRQLRSLEKLRHMLREDFQEGRL